MSYQSINYASKVCIISDTLIEFNLKVSQKEVPRDSPACIAMDLSCFESHGNYCLILSKLCWFFLSVVMKSCTPVPWDPDTKILTLDRLQNGEDHCMQPAPICAADTLDWLSSLPVLNFNDSIQALLLFLNTCPTPCYGGHWGLSK